MASKLNCSRKEKEELYLMLYAILYIIKNYRLKLVLFSSRDHSLAFIRYIIWGADHVTSMRNWALLGLGSSYGWTWSCFPAYLGGDSLRILLMSLWASASLSLKTGQDPVWCFSLFELSFPTSCLPLLPNFGIRFRLRSFVWGRPPSSSRTLSQILQCLAHRFLCACLETLASHTSPEFRK